MMAAIAVMKAPGRSLRLAQRTKRITARTMWLVGLLILLLLVILDMIAFARDGVSAPIVTP